MLWMALSCSNSESSASGLRDSPAAPPAPEPTFGADLGVVDECDPVVHVPGPFGVDNDSFTPDPHADVFGTTRSDPFQVHIGWPGSDPSVSVSFAWRTDPETLASAVQLGTDESLGTEVHGVSFGYGGLPGDPGPERIHELKLCAGLAPDTTYFYRVGGEGHWSPLYSFTTPGTPGTFDTFRVAFVGDSRGTFETWSDVLAGIAEQEPDFVLVSGDLIDFGANQAEWDGWFEAGGDLMARVPFVPAHGNHEFLAVHYFAQFSLPNNEQWFSLRYGNLALVVLNDTVLSADDVSVVQSAWMEPILAGSDARWKLAMSHQPAYSTCTNHGSNLEVRAAWVPVWERTGVDLVVAGHNHVYERSVKIRGDQEADDGITYLVTGGAGADLYQGFTGEWFGAAQASTYHYVIGDFGPDGADFVVRDVSGNVLDRFSLP